MTVDPTSPQIDPISTALEALSPWDSALAVLADVRDTFYEDSRVFWDVGISRYLKGRYDKIVDDWFGGDPVKAATHMDEGLIGYDVAVTVHKALSVTSDPLMMEVLAYAMALATINPGQLKAWRVFAGVIDALYDVRPAKTKVAA